MTPSRVVVIDDMSTARGGSTALALLSARLLAERGVAVTYVTGDDGDSDVLGAANVEVIATGRGRLLAQGPVSGAINGAYDRRIVETLSRFIRDHDDGRTIYHVHGWAQTLSPSVFAPLRRVAHRTLVHCHDFFMACPNGVYFNFQTGKDCSLEPLGGACIRTNCDKRSYAQKLWRVGRNAMLHRLFDQKLPWAGLVMIHPGMADGLRLAGYPDERLITLRNPASAYSSSRIVAEDNQAFAFVGRLETDKGIDGFLVAGHKANVPMVVVGDGPERAQLQREYPRARFTGWAQPHQIGQHLKNCRALVMPSRFREPFGLVAAEASLSGLPVILPDTALIAREIGQSGLGFTYDPRDQDGLSGAMIKARDASRQKIREISTAGAGAASGLGQSHQDWVAGLLRCYGDALQRGAAT